MLKTSLLPSSRLVLHPEAVLVLLGLEPVRLSSFRSCCDVGAKFKSPSTVRLLPSADWSDSWSGLLSLLSSCVLVGQGVACHKAGNVALIPGLGTDSPHVGAAKAAL